MSNAQVHKLDAEITALARIAETYTFKPVIPTILGRIMRSEFEFYFDDIMQDGMIDVERLLPECFVRQLTTTGEIHALQRLNTQDPDEMRFNIINPRKTEGQNRPLTEKDYVYLAAYADACHTDLLGFLVLNRRLVYEPPQHDHAEDLTYYVNIEAIYTKKAARGRGVATYLATAAINAIVEDMETLHPLIPEGSTIMVLFYSEWLSTGGANFCNNIVECVEFIQELREYNRFEIDADMTY